MHEPPKKKRKKEEGAITIRGWRGEEKREKGGVIGIKAKLR